MAANHSPDAGLERASGTVGKSAGEVDAGLARGVIWRLRLRVTAPSDRAASPNHTRRWDAVFGPEQEPDPVFVLFHETASAPFAFVAFTLRVTIT